MYTVDSEPRDNSADTQDCNVCGAGTSYAFGIRYEDDSTKKVSLIGTLRARDSVCAQKALDNIPVTILDKIRDDAALDGLTVHGIKADTAPLEQKEAENRSWMKTLPGMIVLFLLGWLLAQILIVPLISAMFNAQ